MTEPHPIFSDPTGPELMPPRPPDVTLGTFRLWIEGPQGSSGWLDCVAYVGDHFQTLMHTRGALMLKADLDAFGAGLSRVARDEASDAILPRSGPLGLRVGRVSPGSTPFCEVGLGTTAGEQKISLHCRPAQLQAAVDGVEAALARLARERAKRWLPAILGGSTDVPPAPRLVGPVGRKPGPERPAQPKAPPLPAFPEPEFKYVVDGPGWHGVTLRVGDRVHEMGGSDIGADMIDLLRAALALAAGAPRAELVFNGEPDLERLEFEAVYGYGRLPPHLPCRIRAVELRGRDAKPGRVAFEAVCLSGLGAARALYRMALPHFIENDRYDRLTFAALEGALAAIDQVVAHDPLATAGPSV